MRIMDDIELNTKQLEDNYKIEILKLKKQIDADGVHHRELQDNLLKIEQEKHSLLSEYSSLKVKFEKQTIELSKVRNSLETKTSEINELQSIIKENEAQHLESIEGLKIEIDNIKESNSNVIKLYEYQNGFFRERVAKEIEFLNTQLQSSNTNSNDCNSYANLMSELSQRDAV